MTSNHQNKNNDGTISTLKVAGANSRDVGRRIGRVDPKVANEMALSTGDAIEISAGKNKKTTVLHWPAYQEDYGRGLIRIDGYIRYKLDVGINDSVDIRKVQTKEAQQITLAPTEPLRIMGAEACESCATSELNEPDAKKLVSCAQINRECTVVRWTSAALMSMDSQFAKQFCNLCAEICDACAQECQRHNAEHCERFAQACRSHAQECRSMSTW